MNGGSSGRALRLVISINTTTKPISLPMLLNPSVSLLLGIFHHSKSIYCLLVMGNFVPSGFLPHLSALSYILFPVFFGVLLLAAFLYRFGPLCHPGYIEILYMWCYYSSLYKNFGPVHFILAPGVDHMLLLAVILLVTF